MIKTFVQGTPSHDRELFALLGRAITDLTLHKRLGTAITSAPGDVWHVNIDRNGNVECFAASRALKDGASVHIRFLADILGRASALDELLAGVIAWARENKIGSLRTRDRRDASAYARAGFESSDLGKKDFVKWEKSLKAAP